jgi:pilus assembly protein CpaE
MTHSARVLVLAGGQDLLDAAGHAARRLPGASVAVMAPCDPRTLNGALSGAQAVVAEIDLGRGDALAELNELIRRAPDGCRIIAAPRNADGEDVRLLFRSGAADVLVAPFTAEAVHAAVAEQLRAPQPARTGKVVAVLKAAGGAGATTLTANLAWLMREAPGAKGPSRRTAVLDFDLQFGDAALAFDVQARHGVLDALQAGEKLDASFFEGVLTEADAGLRVLAAPTSLVPLDAMDGGSAQRLTRHAAASHDVTFVDMPAAWTDWTAPVLAAADLILLVAPATVAGAAGARRVLDALVETGVHTQTLLVLNRVPQGLDARDRAARIGRALDRTPAAVLPEDGVAAKAGDKGALVADAWPKSALSKALRAAAAEIEARLSAEPARTPARK